MGRSTPATTHDKSPRADPPKHKRKGTRSVSTLSASQLARKRANDREAQRAIRARTKETIDSLTREVESYRSGEARDSTIRELREKNQRQEEELAHYRTKFAQLGLDQSLVGSYARQPYETNNMSRTASTDSRGEYNAPLAAAAAAAAAADYAPQYVTAPDQCEPWTSAGMACPIATPATATPAGSSPASTTNDDYRFMTPNSITHHGFDGLRLPPTSMPLIDGTAALKIQEVDAGEWDYNVDGGADEYQAIKLNTDEVSGYARTQAGALASPYGMQQQQSWVYSTGYQAHSPGM